MYKHVAITSTSVKWLEPGGQIKHPLDPSLGNELIAKPMTWPTRHESPHRAAHSAKGGNGRVAPGPRGCGRRPWCQRILCVPCQVAWWLRIRSGGQCRCTEDTHTNSDRLPGAPRDVERLHISHLDIQYALLWAWQSGCNTYHSLYLSVFACVFLYHLWVLRVEAGDRR